VTSRNGTHPRSREARSRSRDDWIVWGAVALIALILLALFLNPSLL
jgi:hypothetical protein